MNTHTTSRVYLKSPQTIFLNQLSSFSSSYIFHGKLKLIQYIFTISTKQKALGTDPTSTISSRISHFIFSIQNCVYIFITYSIVLVQSVHKKRRRFEVFFQLYISRYYHSAIAYSHRAFNMGILYKILPPLDPFSTFYRKIQKLRHCTVYRKNIYTQNRSFNGI